MSVTSRWQTPPQVAEDYGVDPHRVVAWIKSGKLHAINVSDGLQRPRYRISPEALVAFELARSAGPEPKVSRIRRHKPEGVIEFF